MLDLFFILHFTYLGGAYAPIAPPPLPTGLESWRASNSRERVLSVQPENCTWAMWLEARCTLRPQNDTAARCYSFELCHLIFTARCYASAVLAMALCPSVCPPVCPSVTSRCSTKTAKRRITQTTPHDSPGTLVFWCQRSPRNSTGVTPYEGAECRWGGSKSATFDQ